MALTLWRYYGVTYAPTDRRGFCDRCTTLYVGASAEVGTCTVCGATVTVPKDAT